MTLPTANGLEFPVVFLTGTEENVFPHPRSANDPGELQEERRPAYWGSPGRSGGCISPGPPARLTARAVRMPALLTTWC